MQVHLTKCYYVFKKKNRQNAEALDSHNTAHPLILVTKLDEERRGASKRKKIVAMKKREILQW